MTVLEVIQRSTEFLARKGVEAPRLQVELLMAAALKLPRLQLYLKFDRPLAEAELEQIRAFVKRRGAREPLQHIIGSTSFCGLEMQVSRDVLVPRPETEGLAERAWDYLERLMKGGAEALTVLDFGTGSGCLAVTIASKVAQAQVYALDISKAALDVAQRNAAQHAVHERIHFIEGSHLAALPTSLEFDLIVTNPPYIATTEIETLAPEVRDFDPRLALDGGPDGLDVIRMLAASAAPRLRPGRALMLEFGDGQGAAVQSIFREHGWLVEGVERDLSGRERILIAHRRES